MYSVLIFMFLRDDLDYAPVLASLPAQMTIFEYLVGCWKRLNTVRSNLGKVRDIEEPTHSWHMMNSRNR